MTEDAKSASLQLPVPATPAGRLLTAEQFQKLVEVPPELEWFANLSTPATRRAYENAIGDFRLFTGIRTPEEFRTVTRAHVIAWRDDLVRRALSGQTIRHRLAALSSLFEYLCGWMSSHISARLRPSAPPTASRAEQESGSGYCCNR